MAETTTKKKAGRPKKTTTKVEEKKVETTEKVVDKKDNNEEMIKELMAQVASLTKQVEESKNEKSDLQQLVDVLKANGGKETNTNLPAKIKVISLLENQLNLSTQPNGVGKVYTFSKLGDSKIIRLQDLEEILSITQYREQAEKGYFYICNADIVEEFGLTDEYEKIFNDKMLSDVENLVGDNCVDVFVGLDEKVRKSLATKMAENIANGARLDRNKLDDIRIATDIDIENMAKGFKEINEKKKK